MAPSEEDITDSRSIIVGRKRSLHTSSEQNREVILIDSSDDDSAVQPRKRMRQDEGNNETKTVKESVGLSSARDQSTNDVEVQVEKSEISQSTSQGNIGQPGAWNQGVQSGLRTSFRNKKTNAPPPPPKIITGATSENNFFDIPTPRSSEQNIQTDPQGIQKSSAISSNSEASAKGEKKGRANHASPNDVMSSTKSKIEKKKQKDRKKKSLSAEDLMSNTKVAAAYIASHQGPLSSTEHNMSSITEGLSFYPIPNQAAVQYVFGDTAISLHEVCDARGGPIALQDLDFRDFVLFVLAENPDLKNTFNDKRAKAAFNCYIYHFYGHVPVPTLTDYLLTANNSPTQTVQQMRLVNSADLPPILVRATDVYNLKPLATSSNNGLLASEKCDQKKAPATASISNAMEGDVIDISSDEVESPRISHDTRSVNSASMFVVPADRDAISKYFPDTGGAISQRCLVCGSGRHPSTECPDSTCLSCHSRGNHLTPACPRMLVCGKCRRTGHQIANCREKLRATQDVHCIICQSPSHVEGKCHFIWRSFLPQDDEIKKVQNIRVYCYCCGRSGHFGPDCGLHQGTPFSGGLSWSRFNLERYLDPAGVSRALSAGKDYSVPSRTKKSFSIKGKADDPIALDDSDDEAPGFIRPKIHHESKHRQIQFSHTGPTSSQFQFQGNANEYHTAKGSGKNMSIRGGGGKKRGGSKPSRGGSSCNIRSGRGGRGKSR